MNDRVAGRSFRIATWALSAGLLAGLATFAWRGLYARYLTDDYCTASALRTLGLFGAMRYHREAWSGRFSYFPLKAAFEAIGPETARVTPFLVIVLLTLAAHVALRPVVSSVASRLSLAIALCFAVVAASPSRPNIGGSLYWETGAVTYMTPLILFLFWTPWLGNRHRFPVSIVASAALMFFAGGLSETSLAAQGALAASASTIFLLRNRRREAWIAAAAFVATLLALAIAGSAPGNDVRVPLENTANAPIVDVIARTFRLANDFVGSYLFVEGLAVVPLLVLSFLIAAIDRRFDLRDSGTVAFTSAAAYVAAFAPSAWLLPGGPPDRALDVPNFFIIVTLAALAYTAGLRFGSNGRAARTIGAAALLFALLIPFHVIRATTKEVAQARRTAVRLDALDRSLRELRGQAVVVRAPWGVSAYMFHEDSAHWANQCIARFYDLHSFRATR